MPKNGSSLCTLKFLYYCKDNQKKLNSIEDQEKFFEFDSGLFLSVDFKAGEKIPYYDENYQVYYKQTLRERKEVRESKRPDLYAKTTNNQSLLCFVK